MSNDEIWNEFLKRIKSVFSLWTFNIVFKDLKLLSYKDSTIIITLPNNELLLQNIKDNYSTIIEDILNDITNDTCTVEYIFNKDINNIKKEESKEELQYKKEPTLEETISNYKYVSNFNPNYTFDTFVVGESNKLAYGTALQLAQNPGKLYNPYFLYGKSGLGKTHLLHAIGNYIVNHSDKKVLYVPTDDFKKDFIAVASSKNKNENNIAYLEAFREKYRNVDVLIMDDIQYLEDAEKTQIEFTNTFRELYENGKQIVIASDRSVEDFKKIEDRLKTRFRWGLTESISPPDLELKKNIIKNKILVNNFDFNISDEIIEFIANNCGNDIRNLELTITRIAAYISILQLDSEITLEIAQQALNEYVEKPIYKVNSVPKIIDVVAKYYGIESSMIKGKMKKKNIADARAITMYLCRILTDESLERIGLEIGARDHSTVIYSYEKISNKLKTDTKLQEEIKILKNKINSE